jgi:Cu+-exporting ATPase
VPLTETKLAPNQEVGKPTCQHCGEDCIETSIRKNQDYFCCQGCQFVYELLHENGMNTFYSLNQKPAFSLINKQQIDYSFLDDLQLVNELLDFKETHKSSIHFILPQIHCSSCLWLLENLYKINAAVLYSRVDFIKKEVQIIFNNQDLSLRQLVELLDKIGYPPDLNFEGKHTKSTKKGNTLNKQLGLAGFVFGNVMLFSFPEYLGLQKEIYPNLFSTFNWLSLLLCIPLILYSAKDYFKSAFLSLQYFQLNINVPISIGITTLFLRSVYEFAFLNMPGYFDSLAGLIFFLLIGKWYQNKVYARFRFDRDFKSFFPISVSLMNKGEEKRISLNQIKTNDIIRLRNQDIIPADGTLRSNHASLDYSFVTGESHQIKKIKGDKLFAGGKCVGEPISMKVSKKVNDSYLPKLWDKQIFKKQNKSKLNTISDKISTWFTITIISLSIIGFAYWFQKDINMAFNVFTSVLIIACPCAIALTIPFIFGNTSRLLNRVGIHLKNTEVLETLPKINTIIFDKTGTLTNINDKSLTYEGESLTQLEKSLIYSLTNASNHPISKKISSFYAGEDLKEITNFKERQGLGIEADVDGIHIKIGSHKFIGKDFKIRKTSSAVTLLEINGKIKGAFKLETKLRAGISKLIKSLQKDYNLQLLSGDNDWEKTQFDHLFASEEMHYNHQPEDKLNFIKTQQQKGQNIAMIGDGLNDAGALQQSNLGISIMDDQSNFCPASDIIIRADQINKINDLFRLGKNNLTIVYLAYGIAFCYNIIGLYFALQGALSPLVAAILMPLSSISIIIFAMVSSSLIFFRSGINKQ